MPTVHDVLAGLCRSYLFEDLTSEEIAPLAATATTRSPSAAASAGFAMNVTRSRRRAAVSPRRAGPVRRSRRPASGQSRGRSAGYTYNVISTWTEPAEDDQHKAANRAFASALAPMSIGGAYVNFAGDTDVDRVRSLYGNEIYDRLARLKREYDPSNLFSRNQNIRPAR